VHHEHWFSDPNHGCQPGPYPRIARHVQGAKGKQVTLLYIVMGCIALALLIYLLAALLKPEWFG
jgi:K+-transporting ATPase KdpF subunit